MTAIEGEQLCIGGDTLSLCPLLSFPEGNKVSVARSVRPTVDDGMMAVAVNCGRLMYDKSRGTLVGRERGEGRNGLSHIDPSCIRGRKGTGKRRLRLSQLAQGFQSDHSHNLALEDVILQSLISNKVRTC